MTQKTIDRLLVFYFLAVSSVLAGTNPRFSSRSTYVLGPDDQIVVKAVEVDEISDKPIRIDNSGQIELPLTGSIHAAGLTVEELQSIIATRLKKYVRNPDISVNIFEYRSQPVSVLGAVRNPGVHQLEGHKTLIEMISLAGGIDADAGYGIKITRRKEWGDIPLPYAKPDPSGEYSLAEVKTKDVLGSVRPEENIIIMPYDVISIPRAEMVYVIGSVNKPGGYTLHSDEAVSVLQALSLAEGMNATSSPQSAKILRPTPNGGERKEISVDIKKIFEGKASDVPLKPSDILFIPTSVPKNAMIRGLEAAVQIGTGVAIYRH